MSFLICGMKSLPQTCRGCDWRDAEAGGNCELMIGSDYETYTEQYLHCPFKVLAERFSLVPVPPHDGLIEYHAAVHAVYNGYKDFGLTWQNAEVMLEKLPIIIPAEEGE